MATFFICVLLFVGAVCGNESGQPYDTIVVGLGSSGVTAATTLARSGKRVLGLEAQDYVGGRVKTVRFGDGIVELGAEWIHGTVHSRVYDLAIANNISVVPQDVEMSVYQSDGTLGNTTQLGELVEFCLQLNETHPGQRGSVGKFLTDELKEHLRKNKPELLEDKDYVEEALEYLNLLITLEIAANDWNDISVWTKYETLEGHQETSWHEYGYKTFFELMMNKYNNGPGLPTLETKLNTEVTLIRWPQDPEETVKVTTMDGTVYEANNVIVTVSLGVLKAMHKTLFSPPLPAEKERAIDKISMGIIAKIILAFPDQQWWPDRSAGYEFLWRGEDRQRVAPEDRWTLRIGGTTTPLANNYTLTMWASGDAAKMVETLPEDEVKHKCMSLLRQFMGTNLTIPEPTLILRSNWFSNPYTRGSYTYDNVQVVDFPTARFDLSEPLADSSGKPRVLFAGEATNEQHFATVHGASETGYREAMRLLETETEVRSEARKTVGRVRTVGIGRVRH